MPLLRDIPGSSRRHAARLVRQPGATGLRERPLPKHHATQMTASIRPNPMSGRAP
jgi:hypothetical protein